MGGNPIWLIFLGIGLAIFVALAVLAILQRRMYADQIGQVKEILREARQLADEGKLSTGEEDDSSGSDR